MTIKQIAQAAQEQDALTGWRRLLFWQSTGRRRAKRRYHKTGRRHGRGEVRQQPQD